MALKDAIVTVLNRNAFYRDGYRLLLRVSIIQGIVIVVLVAGIISLFLSIENKRIYFATTSDGRIISIVPLDNPYRSNGEVLEFAARTARSTMSFDYRDYRDNLQRVSADFTTIGWESFSKALKESNIIDALTAHKLIVSMKIDGAPEIKQESVKEGVYTWYLQMPVTIEFDGDQPPEAIRTILLLQIVRVSTLQNPEGISIEQWVTVSPSNK